MMFTEKICKINKISSKLTGTLGYFINLKKIKESTLTTPSNLDLYQFAYSSKKENFNYISEASSNGIHHSGYICIPVFASPATCHPDRYTALRPAFACCIA